MVTLGVLDGVWVEPRGGASPSVDGCISVLAYSLTQHAFLYALSSDDGPFIVMMT